MSERDNLIVRRQKVIKGIVFVCRRPGRWISACGSIGIFQMLAGLQAEQWEVYENEDGGDPLDGDMVARGLTMAEAIEDWVPNQRRGT